MARRAGSSQPYAAYAVARKSGAIVSAWAMRVIVPSHVPMTRSTSPETSRRRIRQRPTTTGTNSTAATTSTGPSARGSRPVTNSKKVIPASTIGKDRRARDGREGAGTDIGLLNK